MSTTRRSGRGTGGDLSAARKSVEPLRPSGAGKDAAALEGLAGAGELIDGAAGSEEARDQALSEAPNATEAAPPLGRARPAPAAARGPRRPRFGALHRLYQGRTNFDFVGRRRLWFAISGMIIVAGIISLSFRGFNFGIEFKGGTSWTVQAPGISATRGQSLVQADGVSQPVVEVLGGKTLQVQADLNSLPKAQQRNITAKVTGSLARLGHTTPNNVSMSTVGPTWGGMVSQKAIEALIAFFVVVAAYISLRFEWKMAVAAIVAVVHDLLVTAGVYSLSGLQVTPDTVIAVLTILGYSLYDTVVVFDRVRDNSNSFGGSGRMTYSDMVNLSMNQTLARSINTSAVAILPVLAVLLIGAEILGATTLQEFGLALFIGLLSGAYSSIFIASPVLAALKEREPRYHTVRKRLETRGDRLGQLTPAAAAALFGGGPGAGRPRQGRPGGAGGAALRPGGRGKGGPGSGPRSSRNGAGTRDGHRGAGTVPSGAGGRAEAGAAAGTPAEAGAAAGTLAEGSRASSRQGSQRPPPRPSKRGKARSRTRRR